MRNAATDDEPLPFITPSNKRKLPRMGSLLLGGPPFFQAIVDAGLVVDGTWPIRTELANRMGGKGANALASSIVLVCRKLSADAGVITRADFVRVLKLEMPEAIDDIRKAGVGPVDMQQSVIGPGMGVFSRYAKVLEDDDSADEREDRAVTNQSRLGRDRERARRQFRCRNAGRTRLVRDLWLR